MPDGSFELLLAAMRLGHDLADGLIRLAAASRIVWPDLPLALKKGHDLRLCVPGVGSVPPQRRLYVEMVVVVLYTACCWMAGQRLSVRRVVAPRSRPGRWCRL